MSHPAQNPIWESLRSAVETQKKDAVGPILVTLMKTLVRPKNRNRHPDLAEELLVHVFGKLMRPEFAAHLPRIRDFQSYVRQMITNREREILRGAPPDPASLADLKLDPTDLRQLRNPPATPIHIQEVMDCLKCLTAEQRRFLDLRRQEKTVREIAKLTGVPTRTVERRMGEAWDALRAELRKRGFF